MIYKYEPLNPKDKRTKLILLICAVIITISVIFYFKSSKSILGLVISISLFLFILAYFTKTRYIISKKDCTLTFQSMLFMYFGINKAIYRINNITEIEVIRKKHNNKIKKLLIKEINKNNIEVKIHKSIDFINKLTDLNPKIKIIDKQN